MQEIACCDAVCLRGRIERTPVAGHPVVDARPLRVIEDIEGFSTELEPLGFGNSKVLKQGHVKIGPAWITEEVAS